MFPAQAPNFALDEPRLGFSYASGDWLVVEYACSCCFLGGSATGRVRCPGMQRAFALVLPTLQRAICAAWVLSSVNGVARAHGHSNVVQEAKKQE